MSDIQNWYYTDEKNQQVGPISSEQLQELANRLVIVKKTYLWTESLEDWIPASKVEGLFDSLNSTHGTNHAAAIPQAQLATPILQPTQVLPQSQPLLSTPAPQQSEQAVLKAIPQPQQRESPVAIAAPVLLPSDSLPQAERPIAQPLAQKTTNSPLVARPAGTLQSAQPRSTIASPSTTNSPNAPTPTTLLTRASNVPSIAAPALYRQASQPQRPQQPKAARTQPAKTPTKMLNPDLEIPSLPSSQ